MASIEISQSRNQLVVVKSKGHNILRGVMYAVAGVVMLTVLSQLWFGSYGFSRDFLYAILVALTLGGGAYFLYMGLQTVVRYTTIGETYVFDRPANTISLNGAAVSYLTDLTNVDLEQTRNNRGPDTFAVKLRFNNNASLMLERWMNHREAYNLAHAIADFAGLEVL